MREINIVPEGWDYEVKSNTIEDIENIKFNNYTAQGIVEKCDENFNLHVKLGNNIYGIMPRNEIEAININSDGIPKENLCTGKVNKFIQFKIKDFDKEERKAILSRKEVQNEALNWIKNDLKVGQKVNGIVKNIQPYGAFIEIGGGVVGLAHIEDLSVARIKSPYERLKIGQKINVTVKFIDRENGQLILSYKENFGTWKENASKFEQGMKVKGIVRETEKNKNGIFIELTPNLVGMAEYQEGLEYGQEINVYIKRIISDRKKIKLVII